MKKLLYGPEAFFLLLLFLFFKIIPPQTASAIGGWMGRTLGPKLAASRKAEKNLQRALPDLDKNEQDKIIREMWDNLGRVIAEYPHLEKISRDYTTFEDEAALKSFFEKDEAAVLFSAHLANWEINGTAILTHFGKPVDLTYRALNNPWADKILSHARTLGGRIRAYPKSRSSGKDILEAIKQSRYLGILIDQKYNEGINVPFFGLPAMTNPIFVKLAQKYKCPLLPVHNTRLKGAHFRIKIAPPLATHDENGNPRPVEDIIAESHTILENWIRENPGQWLWLHRRWPKQEMEENKQ